LAPVVPPPPSLPIPPVPLRTPLKHDRWAALLTEHPNQEEVQEVLNFIKEGARIHFEPSPDSQIPIYNSDINLTSARDDPETINQFIKDELALNRIAGPFSSPPFPQYQVSPLGVVPKEGGKSRVIFHLSFPNGLSVNDSIPKLECKLGSFDSALEKINQAGPGTLLAKVDIKSAFRLIPVHNDDIHNLCFQWQGKYYVDCCLPFGMRSSPPLWERAARLLHWMFSHHLNIPLIEHYVDDFLFILPTTTDQARIKLQQIIALCNDLGVPLSHNKIEGPDTTLTFLGLGIDTVAGIAFIPSAKREKIMKILTAVHMQTHLLTKVLRSTLGSLYFLTRIIPQGKAFLRRGIQLLKGRNRFKSMIKTSIGWRNDIEWWLEWLPKWSGISTISSIPWTPSQAFHIYTDACLTGGGAWFQNEWVYFRWSAEVLAAARRTKRVSMPFLELLAVVQAVKLWHKQLQGHNLMIHCDCLPAVQACSKMASPNPNTMFLVRMITLLSIHNQFQFRISHITTNDNFLADNISRFNFISFLQAHPSAKPDPILVSTIPSSDLPPPSSIITV